MNNRMEKIVGLSRDNNISFLEVMEIYSKFNYRVYFRATKQDHRFQLYNPILEEQTLKLTERYFRRYGKEKGK